MGALYNWYTVNTKKLSPIGWHVPTDAEWNTLRSYLIADSAGISGFSALPGGFRYHDGTFSYQSSYGYWWSATELDAAIAWSRYLYCDLGYLSSSSSYKSCGFSVRLIRD